MNQKERTTGFLQVNGIDIAYEIFGANRREAVLLIAGTGMQLIEWPMELINGLVDAGYRVIRFDNRDCGLSTKLENCSLPDFESIIEAAKAGSATPLPYTLSCMAGDSIGVLDALGIQRAHLVGASMGGAIAQLCAIDFPNRMLSLTLIAADSGNQDIPVVAKPEAFAHIPPAPKDRAGILLHQIQIDQVLNSPGYPRSAAEITARRTNVMARDFDPAALERQQAAVFFDRFISNYRYTNLHKIKVPTLIFHGTHDVLVPVEAAKDLAQQIPGAKLRLISGMNHSLPPALAPQLTAAIIQLAAASKNPPSTNF